MWAGLIAGQPVLPIAGADACVPRPIPIRPEPPFLGHSANVPLAHLRNWALDNITRLLNLNPAGTAP